jgi:Helicase HerA, central domain
MSKRNWDDPVPPSKWDQPEDAERFEKYRLRYRDTPASGIRIGKSLTGEAPVFITPRQISTHMQVVGSTGLGKSYFLEGITKSLILQGRGVCLIDPHGDLYHRTLDFCAYLDRMEPERRLSTRVVPFDIAEGNQIIGFNPMQRNARVMTYQVLALMEAIRKVWGQDSFQATPRLARWLFNAAYAVIDANLTMVQMQYLVDPKPSPYREAIVQQIKNPRIRAEWEWFASLRDRDRNEFTESSFNRLQPFVIHEVIRQILGRRGKTLDFAEVLSGQKIVLVNLAKQSTIPEDYQHLLGTLLVNEILTAAFARPAGKRNPFFLVIDEFAHFVTKDMCEMLDGGRKFGLHLILAHQHLNQLKVKDPEVYYSTLGNARIKTVFGGLIDEDLEIMTKEFFVGELDSDEIKDEVWQTKFRPVESTRTVVSNSWSESSGESSGIAESYGQISHSSLISGEVHIPGSGLWTGNGIQSMSDTRGEGVSKALGQATSRNFQSTQTGGGSATEVPWYEFHEYRELSSRSFRSLEEQLYLKEAQLKRQSNQHAALLVPDQRVQLIKTSTIKEHPITESAREEFKEPALKRLDATRVQVRPIRN